MPIAFRDFVPRRLKKTQLFKPAEYESMETVLAAVNAWIEAEQVAVINVETVVLPNIHNINEEGSSDPALVDANGHPAIWHQLVRVWHRA